MNAEKLAKLQAQVRTGGKGTARRKKKVVHKTAATDDKKLQSALKKISVNQIPGIEEVNMIKDDGTVMHFNNPKVQASLASNTFSVAGHAENKQITELLPGILNQLGAESLSHLRKLAGGAGGLGPSESVTNEADDEDDDVPDLVENFDEACKDEVPTSLPSYVKSESENDADCENDEDSETNIDSDKNPDSETNIDSEKNAESETNIDSEKNAESETNIDRSKYQNIDTECTTDSDALIPLIPKH